MLFTLSFLCNHGLIVILHLRMEKTERMDKKQTKYGHDTSMRMEPGKRERGEAGKSNGHPKAACGEVFVETEREMKAHDARTTKSIQVDSDGVEKHQDGTSKKMLACSIPRK